MSTFTFLVLCVQVCLIQTVLGQYAYNQNINLPNLGNSVCGLNGGALGLSGSMLNQGKAALNSVSSASCATYGGMGTGKVGVAGDVSANGNTVVVGSVPVLGAVDFSGVVPASGSVSISGQCGCGCSA